MSRKKAYRLTEKPSACRISCFTVEMSVCSSCCLVEMLLGHRLACPAIGLGRNGRSPCQKRVTATGQHRVTARYESRTAQSGADQIYVEGTAYFATDSRLIAVIYAISGYRE